MGRFNSKGMWNIPYVKKKQKSKKKVTDDNDDLIIVEECYCPNGHNLVTPDVEFQERHGILIKIKKGKDQAKKFSWQKMTEETLKIYNLSY